jgi:hypothetical protein
VPLSGNPQTDYPIWRKLVFEAIRRNIGREAGNPTDDIGDYQNVVFLMDLVDNYGKVKVDIRLTQTLPTQKRRAVVVEGDWYDYTGDPETFANRLIEAYRQLLHG